MVAIYARQSVFKEDSLSIETQIEKCKLHIKEGETFKIYKDGPVIITLNQQTLDTSGVALI